MYYNNLHKAIRNGDISKILMGDDPYVIVNVYADKPTDFVLVLRDIFVLYEHDPSIIDFFKSAIIELAKTAKGTWVLTYYLSGLMLRSNTPKNFNEITLKISKAVRTNLIGHKIELQNDHSYVGSMYVDGLWGDIMRLLNNLKNNNNGDEFINKIEIESRSQNMILMANLKNKDNGDKFTNKIEVESRSSNIEILDIISDPPNSDDNIIEDLVPIKMDQADISIVDFNKKLSKIDFTSGNNTRNLEEFLLACIYLLNYYRSQIPTRRLFLEILDRARNSNKVNFDDSWIQLYSSEIMDKDYEETSDIDYLKIELCVLITDLILTKRIRSKPEYVEKYNWAFEWDTEGGVRFYNGVAVGSILGYISTRFEGEYRPEDYEVTKVNWNDFGMPIWMGISYE